MAPILGIWASGATPSKQNSYESIATTTVGAGGAADVTFSSIPSTYTHLQIRFIARGDYAATNLNLAFQLNSDTSNAYTYHQLIGDGSTAAAYSGASQGLGFAGRITQASAGSNIFGAGVIDILDYKDTNKYKTVRSLGGWDNNGSGMMTLQSSLYMSASAVSTIKLYGNLGNLTQYSSFALYGIK